MPGSDLVALVGQAIGPVRDDDLDEAAAGYAAAAKASSTRRAYVSDWRDFTRWCRERGALDLPADDATLTRYFAGLARGGRAVSTIDRRVAAINFTHRLAGHDAPTGREAVRLVLAGIRNATGRLPRKKKALTDDLVAKVLRPVGRDLAGLRDRAMIGLCFAAALRRSELVALDVADIELHHRGLIVTVRRSKTDQTGKGKRKGVPNGKLKIPDAVQAWIEAAGIKTGPLFRSCDRGKLGSDVLDGGSFARMLKRRCEAVGLDPKLFSGHSCRRGFATSADEHGADLKATSRQLGHAKLDTTMGYMEAGDLFRQNAGKSFV